MGKLIWFNMITPQGYFEGENGALDWHNANPEFTEFAIAQLEQSSTMLFGRKTFEMMEAYWPTEMAFKDDPIVAQLMNDTKKIVISKTTKSSHWKNTTFFNDDLTERIIALKQRSEKNILIFGSATLANSFMELGLIDEFRLMVNPILLGGGKPLFKHMDKAVKLKLIHSKIFESGNVLLCYTPTETPKYVSP
jgi:dihydrofolate reductase